MKKAPLILIITFFLLFAFTLNASAAYNIDGTLTNKAVFLLDPGHGGDQDGAVNGTRKEKDDNLRLALAVADILETNGYSVALTRAKDVNMTAGARVYSQTNGTFEYFVSFHRNSSSSKGLNGFEVYTDSTNEKSESKKIADFICDSVSKKGIFVNRGVSEGNFTVLNRTKIPSVMIQAGFITNDEDNVQFDACFDDVAEGIAEGLMKLGSKSVPPSDKDYVTITMESLNLRATPSTSGEILDAIPYAISVELLETSGNWGKVAYKNTEGWVYMKYTVPTSDFTKTRLAKKEGAAPDDNYESGYITISNGYTMATFENCFYEKLCFFDNERTEYKGDTLYTGLRVTDSFGSVGLTLVVSGDADCDGKMTLNDCLAIKTSLKGVNKMSEAEEKASDMNSDGQCNVFDYLVLKHSISK